MHYKIKQCPQSPPLHYSYIKIKLFQAENSQTSQTQQGHNMQPNIVGSKQTNNCIFILTNIRRAALSREKSPGANIHSQASPWALVELLNRLAEPLCASLPAVSKHIWITFSCEPFPLPLHKSSPNIGSSKKIRLCYLFCLLQYSKCFGGLLVPLNSSRSWVYLT